jgi:hypothetical protein
VVVEAITANPSPQGISLICGKNQGNSTKRPFSARFSIKFPSEYQHPRGEFPDAVNREFVNDSKERNSRNRGPCGLQHLAFRRTDTRTLAPVRAQAFALLRTAGNTGAPSGRQHGLPAAALKEGGRRATLADWGATPAFGRCSDAANEARHGALGLVARISIGSSQLSKSPLRSFINPLRGVSLHDIACHGVVSDPALQRRTIRG